MPFVPTRTLLATAATCLTLMLASQSGIAEETPYSAKDFTTQTASDRLEVLRWEVRHVKSTLDLVSDGTDFLTYDFVSLRDGGPPFRLPIALPKEWVLNQIKSLTYSGRLEPEAAAALGNFYAEQTERNVQTLALRYQTLLIEVSNLEKQVAQQ